MMASHNYRRSPDTEFIRISACGTYYFKEVRMPCYCEPTNEELEPVRVKIRDKVREILHLIKQESYGNTDNLDLLKDTHKLMDHLYYGNCDEKE